jgi:hypothetical protein
VSAFSFHTQQYCADLEYVNIIDYSHVVPYLPFLLNISSFEQTYISRGDKFSSKICCFWGLYIVSHALHIKLMDSRSCCRVAVIVNLLTLFVKIQYNRRLDPVAQFVNSKESGLEVNVHKIKHTCISISHYQNVGQNHNIKTVNKSFQNEVKFGN